MKVCLANAMQSLEIWSRKMVAYVDRERGLGARFRWTGSQEDVRTNDAGRTEQLQSMGIL